MINFHYQTPSYVPNRNDLKHWLTNCIIDLGYEVGDIDYVFCSSKYIQQINIEHLQHDYTTDIITFNYTLDKVVNTEIYICPKVVKENAKIYNTTYTNELKRVLIHGILHLTGYNDITDEQKKLMRQAENRYLNF